MNARERVLAVLNREVPDRVPVDIWLVPELVEKLKIKLGVTDVLDIYRRLDLDKIVWVGIPYKGTLCPDCSDNETADYWGVRRKKIAAGKMRNTERFLSVLCQEWIKSLSWKPIPGRSRRISIIRPPRQRQKYCPGNL